MAERVLPFGQVTPVARPIGAFVQAAQTQPAAPARPQPIDTPQGVSTIQISGTSNVTGFNQYEQLATALAPFSKALMETAGQGYLSLRKGQIEAGYYDELKNQRAKAMLSLQVQAETSAADAASQIGQLQKVDPQAAQLLDESNPWKLIGRRRALAQLAGSEIENALKDDLSVNAGMLSTLKPDSPELTKRQVQLTSQVLGRFQLNGEEPEVQFYVTPKLNQAWESYRTQQRKYYDAAVEESTAAATVADTSAKVEGLLTQGITVQGMRFQRGTPEWVQYGSAALTYELDRQLAVLAPEARARTVKKLREQIIGTFGSDPVAAQLLQNIRAGDPSMPFEKRPTWGAMAPLETLELQVRGQEAAQKTYDLAQKSVEQKLDRAWYDGPGRLDPADPAYPQALLQFRNQALASGYLNPEEYIAKRSKDQSAFTQVVNPPDPFAVEDFIINVEKMGPGTWTDNPNSYRDALAYARQIASKNPTPEGRKEDYQRMVGAIDKARGAAAEFDPGVRERTQSAVLQDLDSAAVRKIKGEQKVGGKSGDALAQVLAQRLAGGASATAAISTTYQNTKLTAAANQLTALYERQLSTAIRNWKAERPGQVMSPAARSVVMSEAEAAVRKSSEYARIITNLTGRQPGEVGPATVGTDPKNARGIPKAGARSVSDDTVRTYQQRPVMDGRWLRSELENLQRGKPVSPELYNFAQRANTNTFRYLLEQLRFYPRLDPSGDAKRWLQEKVKQQRSSRTVAGNQLSALPSGGGGYNPLRPGGWLMQLLTPPAAAATLPPSAMTLPPPGGQTAIRNFGSGMNGLLAMIRSGEGGWNSVNRGRAGDSAPINNLSSMSIGVIEDMQTRGRVFAVGAYQFTPGVLARARRESGLSPNAPFTPENQNRLAMALITGSKRPALADYVTGKSNNLDAAHWDIAREWAALQAPNGRGVYDGDKGGNRASIPASKVRAMLEQARQEYLGRRDGRRASAEPNTELGNQFVAQLEQQGGYEDTAGLQPLPMRRMFQQAGRPMAPERRARPNGPGYWELSKKDMKVSPALHQEVISRNQKIREAIDKWDPLAAENKQRLNNTNPNPRSRTVAPTNAQFQQALKPQIDAWHREAKKAGALAYGKDDLPVDGKFDLSVFVDDKTRAALKRQVFLFLDKEKPAGEAKMYDMPDVFWTDLRKLGNDLLYEWNANRKRIFRENTVDMIQMGRDAIRPIDLPGQ